MDHFAKGLDYFVRLFVLKCIPAYRHARSTGFESVLYHFENILVAVHILSTAYHHPHRAAQNYFSKTFSAAGIGHLNNVGT